MPSYRMINPDTAEVETHMVTIADMQALKTQGFVPVFESGAGGVISGRDHAGMGGGHGTSEGWKDVLRNIKHINPKSDIDI